MRALGRNLAVVLMAFAAPHALAADAPANPQTIEIALSNFSFAPSALRLQRNVPTILRLTNSASGGHAFSAPQLFAASAIAPEDSSKIANGRVEVPAGQTTVITLTPMTAGSYQIACTHFLHTSFGMRGEAVVE